MLGGLLYGGILIAVGTAEFLLRHGLGRISYRMRLAVGETKRARTPEEWARVGTKVSIWLWSIGGVFMLFSLLSLIT